MARVEIKNEYMADEVKGLILDVGYAELLVQEADIDKIIVSTMRNEEKTASYKCDLENGMLKVNPGNVNIHISVFGGDKGFKKEGIEKDYVLITIPRDKQFEVMELSIGAGSVEVSEFKAASMSVECGVGKMKLKGAVDGNVNMSCGVGSVVLDLDAIESDYNYSISCAVGTVLVNGSKRGGMFANQSVMRNANAKGQINMSCGVGRIELLTQKDL